MSYPDPTEPTFSGFLSMISCPGRFLGVLVGFRVN